MDVVDAYVLEEGSYVCPVELRAAFRANVPMIGEMVGPAELESRVLPGRLEDIVHIDEAIRMLP